MSEVILEGFRQQAEFCRRLGSPLTADIADAAAEVMDDTTATGTAILRWQGDALADALPLRLTGGLHALARRGDMPALTALYRDRTGDAPTLVRKALAQFDAFLLPWISSPPQTNEVGRSGALLAGLMVATERLNMPFELLEMGASAGLNLNLDRFRYRFGTLDVGPPESPVRIAPHWTGQTPPDVWPEIMARAAVDQSPLDPTDPQVGERLIAYVWPDQTERLTRIDAAIALARDYPPKVEAGDAADWIEARLAGSQQPGTARIVMHSVFWQYLPAITQQRIEVAIVAAAKRATTKRPLGWLRFEPRAAIARMRLDLRLWPGGDQLDLADCHPHGTDIRWLV
jgi:hypothetical protein